MENDNISVQDLLATIGEQTVTIKLLHQKIATLQAALTDLEQRETTK